MEMIDSCSPGYHRDSLDHHSMTGPSQSRDDITSHCKKTQQHDQSDQYKPSLVNVCF